MPFVRHFRVRAFQIETLEIRLVPFWTANIPAKNRKLCPVNFAVLTNLNYCAFAQHRVTISTAFQGKLIDFQHKK